MTPEQQAAAFWGSAENQAYSTAERLTLALQALEFFGPEYDRLNQELARSQAYIDRLSATVAARDAEIAGMVRTKDCSKCEGSGRIPCTTPYCTDLDHDGLCNECNGRGKVIADDA